MAGIDRGIDVLLGRGGEHSNQLVGVGGVAIFKRLVAAGLHPLAVDVVFENLGNDSRGHRSSSTLRNAFDCERRARGFYNASRREQTSSVAGGVRSVKNLSRREPQRSWLVESDQRWPGVSGRGCEGARGAARPATSEPRPSFCKLRASSFPLGLKPREAWNCFIASALEASHLPLGSRV